MEVQFRFRQEVTSFEKTKSAKPMSVDIAKVGDPDRFVEVPCHNLIVAAGSHTSEALHELVPWIEPKTSHEYQAALRLDPYSGPHDRRYRQAGPCHPHSHRRRSGHHGWAV
jgi:hypothetical protein